MLHFRSSFLVGTIFSCLISCQQPESSRCQEHFPFGSELRASIQVRTCSHERVDFFAGFRGVMALRSPNCSSIQMKISFGLTPPISDHTNDEETIMPYSPKEPGVKSNRVDASCGINLTRSIHPLCLERSNAITGSSSDGVVDCASHWNVAAFFDDFRYPQVFLLDFEQADTCHLAAQPTARLSINPIVVTWNSSSLELCTFFLVLRCGFSTVTELASRRFDLRQMEEINDSVHQNVPATSQPGSETSSGGFNSSLEVELQPNGTDSNDVIQSAPKKSADQRCSAECFDDDDQSANHPYRLPATEDFEETSPNRLEWQTGEDLTVTLIVAAINAGRPNHYGKGDSSFEGDYLWSLKQVALIFNAIRTLPSVLSLVSLSLIESCIPYFPNRICRQVLGMRVPVVLFLQQSYVNHITPFLHNLARLETVVPSWFSYSAFF